MEKANGMATNTMDSPAVGVIQHFDELSPHTSSDIAQVFTQGQTTSTLIGQANTSTSHTTKQPTTRDLLSGAFNNPLEGLKKLQIVVISDTHGFENQLVTVSSDDCGEEVFSDQLPPGDVLFHLGDFALMGSPIAAEKAFQAFDKWLARQAHPVKIVVRGNHDPCQADFAASGAWYITESTTIQLTCNLVLGVIPNGSRNKGNLPKGCHILATHVPPYNILDQTIKGNAGGSTYLTRVVSSMQDKPKLWLCGHIHEGRGVAVQHWGNQSTTTIINAANSNEGRATHLDHDAVILQVANDDEILSDVNRNPITIVSMGDGKLKSDNIITAECYLVERPL